MAYLDVLNGSTDTSNVGAPDSQAISAPEPTQQSALPDVLTGGPDNSAPAPNPPLDSSALHAPDNSAVSWRGVLRGALQGMLPGAAGASQIRGSGSFAQGIGAGASQALEDARKTEQVQMQKTELASRVKFQDAQAANLAAETAIRDKQLHSMDQKDQDAHNDASLSTIERLKQLGIAPTIVIDNNHGGQEAHAGLQQLTASHGSVPPLFTVNVGNQILGYDLNQLSQAPQGLVEVNRVRRITNPGAPEITQQMFQQMDPKARNEMLNSSLNFGNPMPSEDNLLAYKNYLLTAKAQPKSPEQDAQVGMLDGIVNRMQTALDSSRTRANQQITDKEKATGEYQYRAAETLKAIADAKKSEAEAGVRGADKMLETGINPYTKEQLTINNAPDTMFVDSSGNPIPFKNLATVKPSQQERNRADFAGSVVHMLDTLDRLQSQGKLPNGPLKSQTVKGLVKAGIGGEDAQKAVNTISLIQSAATGAHVGGRFSVEVMKKMQGLIDLNMNDSTLKGATESIRDVMDRYVKQGGLQTVGDYKAEHQQKTGMPAGAEYGGINPATKKQEWFDKNGKPISTP